MCSFRLLVRVRTPLNVVVDAHAWGAYDNGEVIQKTDVYSGRGIFPIQDSIKLYPMDAEAKKLLVANCNDLYSR